MPKQGAMDSRKPVSAVSPISSEGYVVGETGSSNGTVEASAGYQNVRMAADTSKDDMKQ